MLVLLIKDFSIHNFFPFFVLSFLNIPSLRNKYYRETESAQLLIHQAWDWVRAEDRNQEYNPNYWGVRDPMT